MIDFEIIEYNRHLYSYAELKINNKTVVIRATKKDCEKYLKEVYKEVKEEVLV